MKSYQFFKICKHFDEEREKNTYAAVNEKRKVGKSWTLFITGYFIKFFNMIIHHFFVSQSNFCSFDIRMTQEVSKWEVEKGK